MSLKSNYIFLFMSCILGVLFCYNKSLIVIALFLILLFFGFKRSNLQTTIGLLAIFVFFSFYKINKMPNIQTNYVQQNFCIREVKEKYLIIENNKIRYLMYDKFSLNYQINDEIYVEGKIEIIDKDLAIDIFEFKEYMNNKRVFYQINAEKIILLASSNSLSNKIIRFLTFNLKNESYAMTKMLLFNDRYANNALYEELKEINAIHLFVVSGFHILFFFKLICFIFKKNIKVGNIVGLTICTFYVFLLDYSLSSSRALICLFLSLFFKKWFNALDRISICGILFLLIEPLNVFNYSFILTFIMCITIILTSKLLKKFHFLIRMFVQSFICFLAILPIQLLLNYKINLISMISNVFLSYIVSGIFVLCLLGIVFSFINGDIFSNIYKVFNHLIEFLSKSSTSLVLGSLKPYFIVIYYVMLILFLYQLEKRNIKKIIITFSTLFSLLIGVYYRNHFLFYQKVTFLNVYQGDCCIIQDSFNGKVMLIDTGGLINYDIAKQNIMPYLQYHGIRKIDLVVITHNDYDHSGALENLKNYIVIDEIIQDFNIKEIDFGKIKFTNLNQYANQANNENDQSITLFANICSLNFLFTGDISQKIEKQIIEDNPTLKVDVLKVAHHGSKYSTSQEFIAHISPIYAIISVGDNNHYGHPDKDVIEILVQNDIEIYQTNQNGTIRIIGKIFNKYFIECAK